MRTFLNFFRPKNHMVYASALSAPLQQQLDDNNIDNNIFAINNLRDTDLEKANKQIYNIHRSYYDNTKAVLRSQSDLKTHYQSFYQDQRTKNTAIASLGISVLSYIIDSWLKADIPSGCPEQEAMFSTMTKSIGICLGMLPLQFLHHLNYQDEAQQLNSKIHNHQKQANFCEAILKGVGEENLLKEKPVPPASVFQPH